MRVFVLPALLVTLAACETPAPPPPAPEAPALAEGRWTRTASGDGHTASFAERGARITVTCRAGAGNESHTIDLSLPGWSREGPVAFTFDTGEALGLPFTLGAFAPQTTEQSIRFDEAVSALKSARRVTVTGQGAVPVDFSLRGSSRAIGDCVALL
ncbi:MAG: hypothetical protein AAF908_07765 [Pseudomonadota bacterium]